MAQLVFLLAFVSPIIALGLTLAALSIHEEINREE